MKISKPLRNIFAQHSTNQVIACVRRPEMMAILLHPSSPCSFHLWPLSLSLSFCCLLLLFSFKALSNLPLNTFLSVFIQVGALRPYLSLMNTFHQLGKFQFRSNFPFRFRRRSFLFHEAVTCYEEKEGERRRAVRRTTPTPLSLRIKAPVMIKV